MQATQPDPFGPFLDAQIDLEGGYSDPVATGLPDRGGVTNWGITEATARRCGYRGDMRAMPREQALAIYRRVFVTEPDLDRVAEIDVPLALKLCEIGIMSGPATAGRMVQRALNALSTGGGTHPHLVLDGCAGRLTCARLNALILLRGADARRVVLAMVTALHCTLLIELSERSPSQEVFEYGWQLNRVVGTSLETGAAGGRLQSALSRTTNPAATAAALRSTIP